MEPISYKPGTILKIKACDFVTYRKLNYKPIPSLNILLAPNGAGKSSVLSAIILGLGGKTNIIGKSNQISDYISYGKDEAEIRIDLYDPQSEDNTLSVFRVIRRNGTTAWSLNLKKATQKQVDDAMQRLNIQVDNLCQVLPQERVQDFAKMNSLQLLENVQRVLGDDLHSDYHKLIEYRHSLISLKQAIEKNTQLRQDEVTKYQRLENDVAAIEEKKRVLKSVTFCRQKLAWCLFKNKEEEQNKVNGYLMEAKKKLNSFEKGLQPLKEAIHSAERNCNSLNEIVKKRRNKVSLDKDKLRKLVNEIKSSNDHIESIKESLQRRIQDASSHQSDMDNIESKIQELAELLAQENDKELTKQMSDFDRNIKQETMELQSLVQQVNQMKQEQVAINNTLRILETKLEQAGSVGRRRLQMLSTHNQDLFKDHQWLSQNRDKFQSTIYGPLLMELNINNSEGAKYVEFIIPYRDLTSFVTESSQDMTSLLRVLRDKEKLTVNCAHCSPPQSDLQVLFPPKVPVDQIRSLGFDCYLVDLVEGPPTVIKHLCNLCKLHLIPVAFTARDINKNAVAQHNISAYFIGNEFYQVKVSIYSKKASTSVIKVRPSTFLADSIDKKLIHHTQMKLNAKKEALGELEYEMSGMVEARSTVEVELNELRNQKKMRARKLEQYRNTTVRLRKHEEERNKLMSNMFDRRKEEANAYAKIKEILVRNRQRMEEMLMTSKSYCENTVTAKLSDLDYEVSKKIREAKKKELSQHEEAQNKLKSDVEKLRRSVVEVKAEASNLLSKAKDLTEGLIMGEAKFNKQYSKGFASLPDDTESIKAKINSFEAKARCLDNPLHEQCLKDYEAAKSLAEFLGIELEKLSDELNSAEINFNEVNTRWLPRIEHLVSELNSRFSMFFQKISCVGDVRLNKGDDQNAIEKFGLQIRVKFRNDTDLQVLDPFVQSGGERALITAVFLLSLQRLSVVPFRCVDEINQGMDKFNERRMYNLLFNTISDASSQYFLLTPKFLKNVSFPYSCSIFTIFNCPMPKLAKRNHSLICNNTENNVQK